LESGPFSCFDFTEFDSASAAAPPSNRPKTGAAQGETSKAAVFPSTQQPSDLQQPARKPARKPARQSSTAKTATAARATSPVAAKAPRAKHPALGNFQRLNLKRGGGGHRIGAKAKFSKSFKKKNHKNYVGKGYCYSCGQPVRALFLELYMS
jgi:hypothetical protein